MGPIVGLCGRSPAIPRVVAGDAATTADPPTATPEVGGANTGGVAGGTVGGPAAVTGGSNAVVVEPAAVPFEAGPAGDRATLIGNGR